MFILGLWAVTLLLVSWLAMEPTLTALRRQRLRSRPFPPAWRDILRQHVPYIRRLPADLQLQLKQHIQVFMAEKEFIGCAGLEITDEIRMTIAAQACLLLLNRRTDYFPELRSILVYPDRFLVERAQPDADGLVHEQKEALSGESWIQGKVILAWSDVVEGAAETNDGHNVVIHEFAHQLDQENGQATGFPILAGREFRKRWTEVFTREYAQLQHQAQHHQPSLLDHYGATNPAEFFAVASEAFFEQAPRMAEEHPAMYELLSRFYRVNPLSW